MLVNTWITLDDVESFEVFWKYVKSISIYGKYNITRLVDNNSWKKNNIFELKYNPFIDQYRLVERYRLFSVDNFWKRYSKTKFLKVMININIDLNIDVLLIGKNFNCLKFNKEDIVKL